MNIMVNDKDLIAFAKIVLHKLSNSQDWDSDVFDSIAEDAAALGLATTDEDGFFKSFDTITVTKES